jgi:NAD(P)-dependent dehydrogenase (short-subunit alcohol dehydrogenase family)
MSVTTAAPSITNPQLTTRPRSSQWRATVAAGLTAAAVTTSLAAAVHAAGVSLAVGGERIPLAGFAQMTLLGAVLGGVLLAVVNRRSSAPRRHFLQTTAVLTALSCIPSITWPDDGATKLALVAMHLSAAAIIVPVLARQLDD